MTWSQLAKGFLGVILPFAFLALAPIILHALADIDPPYSGVSVLAAIVSGLCIAYVYIILRSRAESHIKNWAIWSGVVFLISLPLYVYAETTWVYRTDPPNRVRRIRGFITVSKERSDYIQMKGSVTEALRGNDWESDGLFTEFSKNVANVLLLSAWNIVFASLCVSITSFALYEGKQQKEKATFGGCYTMRILFLAANPAQTSHLDLEEELRSLEAELRGVKYRDQVVLTARHAVRPDDLVRYVRSERPTVVHFSGHGSGGGIILRNDEGGYTEVTGASLQRFFMNRGVRLVVLNACYTQAQAKLLPGAVSAVVGTTDSVGDVAARRFTVAFYRVLGDGYSIREAFRDGGDAVVLDNREDVFWSDGELDQLLVAPARERNKGQNKGPGVD
jgi:hypothetical protein